MSDTQPSDRGELGLSSLEDLVEIGRGGFATVYRARQPRFGRTVAVKVLDPQADPLSVERFERECEAMGMLSSHPNIVTIFDAGLTDDGKPYLIMEFMPEGSLDDRVAADGALPWDEVAAIGVKLAGALDTAHAATVLHRDVKPANVLRSPFGEPCLSDFGLARFGGQAKTTGVVTATLLHAPPEILAGQPATPRSDVYSLGSSLFTLLTGDAPFWQATDESILPLVARIADDPVPDLRSRGVPAELCAAVEAAMTKDPSDRPQSAAAFGELLREAQGAAGVPATTLPLAGRASVAAAREVASAPTDPNLTIGRAQPPVDSNQTIARGRAPTVEERAAPAEPTETLAPAPGAPRSRRRWPLVVAALVVLIAAGVGAFLVLGGEDDGDDGDTVSAEEGAGGEVDVAPTSPAQLQAAADDLADRLARERRNAGVGRVREDPQLTQEARAAAADAADSGRFQEIDGVALGERHPGRWFLVVTSATAGTTPDAAFDSAVDGTQTRATLLDDRVDVAGIGIALAGDGTYYVVQLLGQSLDT